MSHINSLYTGVTRLPLDKIATLLLENLIEQKEQRAILNRITENQRKISACWFSIVNKSIHNFKKETEESNILEWLLEEKYIYNVRLPYSSAKEKFSKLFVNKLEDSFNGKAELTITWNARKISFLFNYKDKIQHQSCIAVSRVVLIVLVVALEILK